MAAMAWLAVPITRLERLGATPILTVTLLKAVHYKTRVSITTVSPSTSPLFVTKLVSMLLPALFYNVSCFPW